MNKTVGPRIARTRTPGTYTIVGILIGVLAVLVIFGASILQSGKAQANGTPATHDPRFAALTAGTTLTNEVPATLPAQGVTINNQFVIRPLTSVQRQASVSMITANRATTIARTYANAHPFQATTLLGSFTSIASIPPPGATGTTNIIQDVPAWVITFTTTNPQNVTIGMIPPPGQTPTVSAPAPTHFNVVINAKTGAFLLGFFTT